MLLEVSRQVSVSAAFFFFFFETFALLLKELFVFKCASTTVYIPYTERLIRKEN